MAFRKCVLLLISGIFTLLQSINLPAQGPPIFTDTPIMLGLEGRGIRTFGRYISKENTNVYIHPIAVPFNLSAKWQIGGMAPLMSISPKDTEGRFGLSDVKVFTKYQLIQKDGKGKTFRTLIKLEETFPTGNHTDTPALGNGAWQTAIGLVNGYVTTKFGIYAELVYNFISNGLPDSFYYSFAFGLPLLPQQYPPKQINIFIELNGNSQLNSGKNILFLSPGIQWITGRRLLVETGIQLPLAEEASIGQKTNFAYMLGARILIF